MQIKTIKTAIFMNSYVFYMYIKESKSMKTFKIELL
jgi:hypothetical protein